MVWLLQTESHVLLKKQQRCLYKITTSVSTICTCLRGRFPADKSPSWGTQICMGRVQRVVKLDLKWGSPPDQATSFSSLQIRKHCSTLQTWGVLCILEWTTTTKYLFVGLSDLVKQNIGRPLRYDFQIKKYPFSPQYCLGYTYVNKVFFI